LDKTFELYNLKSLYFELKHFGIHYEIRYNFSYLYKMKSKQNNVKPKVNSSTKKDDYSPTLQQILDNMRDLQHGSAKAKRIAEKYKQSKNNYAQKQSCHTI